MRTQRPHFHRFVLRLAISDHRFFLGQYTSDVHSHSRPSPPPDPWRVVVALGLAIGHACIQAECLELGGGGVTGYVIAFAKDGVVRVDGLYADDDATARCLLVYGLSLYSILFF